MLRFKYEIAEEAKLYSQLIKRLNNADFTSLRTINDAMSFKSAEINKSLRDMAKEVKQEPATILQLAKKWGEIKPEARLHFTKILCDAAKANADVKANLRSVAELILTKDEHYYTRYLLQNMFAHELLDSYKAIPVRPREVVSGPQRNGQNLLVAATG